MVDDIETRVDESLSVVGGFRRWNIIVFLLVSLSTFMTRTLQSYSIVFIGWEPPHHCRVPAGQTNDSIPCTISNGVRLCDRCHMYSNISVNNITVPCTDGWVFDNEGYTTIVTEFQLFCDKGYFAELSQTLSEIARKVFGVFTSYFVDRFGRKWLHILSHVLTGCIGIATSFAPSYVTFVILRTSIVMLMDVSIFSGLTYLMELFDRSRRTFVGIGLQFMWMVNYSLPCIISWLVPNWRTYQLIASLLSYIWIMYIWFLPESISWLASKGKYKKAEDSLMFIARMNGVVVSKDDIKIKCLEKEPVTSSSDPTEHVNPSQRSGDILTSKIAKDSTQGIKDPLQQEKVPIAELFCDPKLRLHLLMGNVMWFSNAFVYGSLTLASPSLGGNRFFNYSMLGLVELPANVIALYVTNRYGRRRCCMAFFIIAGIPLFVVAFVPKVTASGINLMPFILILWLIGKIGITGAYAVMLMYVVELFPSNLRVYCVVWVSVGGAIGSMVAPFAAYLAKRVFWLPNILFALFAGLGSLANLLLPETKNMPLPLTTEQVHKLHYRNQRPNKKPAHQYTVIQKTTLHVIED